MKLKTNYLVLGGEKENDSNWFQKGSLFEIGSLPANLLKYSLSFSSLMLLLLAPIFFQIIESGKLNEIKKKLHGEYVQSLLRFCLLKTYG